jgi:hypothetical protein
MHLPGAPVSQAAAAAVCVVTAAAAVPGPAGVAPLRPGNDDVVFTGGRSREGLDRPGEPERGRPGRSGGADAQRQRRSAGQKDFAHAIFSGFLRIV